MTYNDPEVSERSHIIKDLANRLNYYEREGHKELLKKALSLIEHEAAQAKKRMDGDHL